ncbi:hypothetical protein [Nocardia mangyaensis]|uniref:hypothetical protein n=1 Tax=Nocardia mangyaensis TaxID=2213200 RepID=UPI0026769C36|nr:hypothetical protein [Nocardia mangyaensis]MDO3648454.1 hypothetical protein [Nocardia mangyaensis]
MDRPDAHRPIGARQHDPGSADAPFAAPIPIRRAGRDLGAPRPRKPSEQNQPRRTGARHRVEGGPITPAGIPVISLSSNDRLGHLVTEDAYATDRLPVVGGRFDPVARHALADSAATDTAFAIEEPDNGPDTDKLPIITPGFPPPDVHDAWPDPVDDDPDRPAPRARDTWPVQTADEPDRPAPDYGGDDEVYTRMIDRSRRRRAPKWVAPLAASVAGAVLIGGAYLQFRGPAPESAAASSPLEPAPASATAIAASCPTEQIGDSLRSNGAGGTDSGIAAILAFQHAYYVARSGDEARTLVASNAALPSGAAIQAGIDTIPVGTTHCLEIAPGPADGQYLVTITEFRPDAVPIVYNPQLVDTATVGTKTLITSIGPVR